jgi:hypothetical protein
LKTLTIEFHNEDDGTLINMTIGAGDIDLNEYFRAASMNYVAPHALGMQTGKIDEDRQREILMRAYACGVVISTEPKMSEEAIFVWFKKHPKEFDILFEIADYRKNFEDDGNSDEHGQDPTPPGEGDEGAG